MKFGETKTLGKNEANKGDEDEWNYTLIDFSREAIKVSNKVSKLC